jgi:hypothetical protein
MVLVVVVLAFVDGMKGPFFIGRGMTFPVEFFAILAVLLGLVSPHTWKKLAAPPWRHPRPVRMTVFLLLNVMALAIFTLGAEFTGDKAFGLFAAGWATLLLANLVSPRRWWWNVLLAGFAAVAMCLALFARAGHPPR